MPVITIHLTMEQLQMLFENQQVNIDFGQQMELSASNALSDGKSKPFLEFFSQQIDNLRQNGNLRTLETYKTAYKKFKKFLQNEDIGFSHMTGDLMESYQTYLRGSNLAMNTVSFHMRILRRIYNKAVEQGYSTDQHPFRHVYTGMATTEKRALALKEIRKIKNLILIDEKLRFARDLFLFSFYTRGMAFVDMAYLKKSDIKNGVLTYKRHKTGQQLSVHWEQNMQEIVDSYQPESGPYLLPIIHKVNGKERNQYRNIQSKVNLNLKTLAQMVHINPRLSMYCARHSWATIARQQNVPLAIISCAMGHSNEKTTEIYLKSIDNSVIDKVNHQIINLL